MRASCGPLLKDDNGGDYGLVTMSPTREHAFRIAIQTRGLPVALCFEQHWDGGLPQPTRIMGS